MVLLYIICTKNYLFILGYYCILFMMYPRCTLIHKQKKKANSLKKLIWVWLDIIGEWLVDSIHIFIICWMESMLCSLIDWNGSLEDLGPQGSDLLGISH